MSDSYAKPTDADALSAEVRRELEAMTAVAEVLAPLSPRKRLAILRCVQEILMARRDEAALAPPAEELTNGE